MGSDTSPKVRWPFQTVDANGEPPGIIVKHDIVGTTARYNALLGMPDRLILSCNLRGFHSLRMMSFWEKLLNLYPYSRLTRRPVYLRVLAIEMSEPTVFERAWDPPFMPGEAVETGLRMGPDAE